MTKDVRRAGPETPGRERIGQCDTGGGRLGPETRTFPQREAWAPASLARSWRAQWNTGRSLELGALLGGARVGRELHLGASAGVESREP